MVLPKNIKSKTFTNRLSKSYIEIDKYIVKNSGVILLGYKTRLFGI